MTNDWHESKTNKRSHVEATYISKSRISNKVWRLKTSKGSNKRFISDERETNLETKLLEIRHMSRPKFFYHGLPNFVLKTAS